MYIAMNMSLHPHHIKNVIFSQVNLHNLFHNKKHVKSSTAFFFLFQNILSTNTSANLLQVRMVK